MSLKKIQWGDVESDTESEESQQIQQHIQGPELKSMKSDPSPHQSKLNLEEEERIQEKRRMFKQQRMEQLKKIQEINNENVWLFIYKNNNSQLTGIVQKLEAMETIENQYGWDVKVSKEIAKKLISEGFKYKKIFVRILVGNRNYNTERRNDRNREEKKKYIAKDQEQQDEDRTVQNQYTFQKKRKNNQQKNQNGLVTKQSKKQRKNENQKQTRTKKEQNNYKNNPLYQGLGDFRTKQVLKRTVSQKQAEREVFNSGSVVQPPQISKKVSYKKYDKPKYAQKQPKYVQKQQTKPKNKYKQKVIKESSQQQVKIQSPPIEQIQQKQNDVVESDCSQSLPSSTPISPSKDLELACEQQQSQTILQRKQQIFTKQSSFVSQQADKIINQQIDNIQCQEEESEQQKQPQQIAKPKKKKRIRNKDKTIKVQPISNNPFDRLR